jgi:hypothetical protein
MHSLDPIVVLVPLLFYCSPLGVTPIRGVTNICHNHKGGEQENKHWQRAVPMVLVVTPSRVTQVYLASYLRPSVPLTAVCDAENGHS